MFPSVRILRVQGLVSPYGPTLLSCAVFLTAWIFPPYLYSLFLREPNYIFVDFIAFVFFFLCAASFLAGVRAHRFINPAAWKRTSPPVQTKSPFLYICIPLALGTAGCIITLVQYGSHVDFLMLLASQQGEMIKEVGKGGKGLVEGFWAKAPVFLMGFLWWTQFRLQQLRLDRGARLVLGAFWFLCFSLDTFTLISLVDRTALLPLLAGSGLIYLYWRQRSGRLQLGGAMLYSAIGGIAILGSFLLIAYLRGSIAANLLFSNLLGYTIASYNRFAALLVGKMHFLYVGRYVYLITYLQRAYQINKFIPVQTIFNWPTNREIYNSEFAAVALAGLNPRFNWVGVFGYVYVDLGWAAPVYIFCTGIFTGYIWSRLRAGSSLGIVMYPWIASWILLWNSWNMIFNDDFVHLLPVALLLLGWDRLCLVAPVPRDVPAIARLEARIT